MRVRWAAAGIAISVTVALGIGLPFEERRSKQDTRPVPRTDQGVAAPSPPAAADVWMSPRELFEAEGRRADAQDSGKPLFAGWVNGIYIYPGAHAPKFVPDPKADTDFSCSGESRELFGEDDIRPTGYYLEVPSGLPSGAVESEEMWAGTCDGRITFVSRQFHVIPSGEAIGLVLRPDTKAIPIPTIEERVEATRVDGMPAVSIAPVTEAGYGNGAILIRTPKGLLQVGGHDLPLYVLFEIAASMRFD